MLVLAFALAAILTWAAAVYFGMRHIRLGNEGKRESNILFQLKTAPWSDRHVESLLARNPRNPALLDQYVRNALERKDLPEALHRAEMFTARAPRSPDGWLAHVDALRRTGREEESLALLRTALHRLPRSPEILAAWAHEAARRKDWAEAARRFERVRQRAPNLVDGYESAANALVEDGRPEAAEALIAEGMHQVPNAWPMWQAAARIAERQGNREEAIRRWEALCAQFPGQPVGYLRLAEALTQAGRREAAADLLRQARDFFPGNKEVAKAAARLLPPEGPEPLPPPAWPRATTDAA